VRANALGQGGGGEKGGCKSKLTELTRVWSRRGMQHCRLVEHDDLQARLGGGGGSRGTHRKLR
jgi:hypothetical protein